MDRHGVSRRRIVATSAARDAGNADEFMREATAIVGAAPDVLSGEEEGRLSFLGATAHLPEDLNKDAGPVLVVDIGGGSTELSVGTPASTTGTPQPAVTSVSLDLGCVRVSERYFAHDPPAPGEVAQALADVEASVTSARSGLPHLPAGGVAVGLAGTVSTVASLERNVAVYERTLLHHAEFPRAAVERWLRILAAEKTAARLERPGMSAGREDVIVGGVVILAVVMKVFEASRCLYSEDDILDGMVIDMLREDRTDT
jgi:exopolyphosphatase/guanosine-5'-triphosphate,3'-diphosphate pyrophosphatase